MLAYKLFQSRRSYQNQWPLQTPVQRGSPLPSRSFETKKVAASQGEGRGGEGGSVEPAQRNRSTCIHACMFVCLLVSLSAMQLPDTSAGPNQYDYSFQKMYLGRSFRKLPLKQSLAPSQCIHACLQACLQACLLSYSNPPDVLRPGLFLSFENQAVNTRPVSVKAPALPIRYAHETIRRIYDIAQSWLGLSSCVRWNREKTFLFIGGLDRELGIRRAREVESREKFAISPDHVCYIGSNHLLHPNV